MLRPFRILEPRTIEEASGWLGEAGGEAAIYAGGTELLLLMNEGLVHYDTLINLKTVPNLDQIGIDADRNVLRVGPLVTHRELEYSETIREYAPLLAEVESGIANIRVRAMGTLGGNLAFAEPHSDPATLLTAWGADLTLQSAGKSRTVPVEAFLLGMFETALGGDEIVTGIEIPLLNGATAGAYEKFSTHERPTATAAAFVEMQDDVIASARIAVGSVGPLPVRISRADTMLMGAAPEEDLFRRAGEMAAETVDPVDDLYGSADYKRHLSSVLTLKALRRAAEASGHMHPRS